MLISDEYLALQRELHARTAYGVSGGKWARKAMFHAQTLNCREILDYGCGRGYFADALRGAFPVLEYDPAIRGKDARQLPADMVYCGDVLEHIEPDCLDDVLDDIKGLARIAVFLVVDTMPAKKHLADGRNAHLIVEQVEWWLPKIRARWGVIEFSGKAREFSCLAVRQ